MKDKQEPYESLFSYADCSVLSNLGRGFGGVGDFEADRLVLSDDEAVQGVLRHFKARGSYTRKKSVA